MLASSVGASCAIGLAAVPLRRLSTCILSFVSLSFSMPVPSWVSGGSETPASIAREEPAPFVRRAIAGARTFAGAIVGSPRSPRPSATTIAARRHALSDG